MQRWEVFCLIIFEKSSRLKLLFRSQFWIYLKIVSWLEKTFPLKRVIRSFKWWVFCIKMRIQDYSTKKLTLERDFVWTRNYLLERNFMVFMRVLTLSRGLFLNSQSLDRKIIHWLELKSNKFRIIFLLGIYLSIGRNQKMLEIKVEGWWF